MEIRPYRDTDQHAIDAIQHESQLHLSASTPDGFFDDLQDIPLAFSGGVFLVAVDSEEVVGFGGLLPSGEIVRMRVSSAHRRKGIALELLTQIANSASKLDIPIVYLHTLAEQEAAISLYARFGFQETDREEIHGNEVVRFEYDLQGTKPDMQL